MVEQPKIVFGNPFKKINHLNDVAIVVRRNSVTDLTCEACEK